MPNTSLLCLLRSFIFKRLQDNIKALEAFQKTSFWLQCGKQMAMGCIFESSRPEVMVPLNKGSGSEEREGDKSARCKEQREDHIWWFGVVNHGSRDIQWEMIVQI